MVKRSIAWAVLLAACTSPRTELIVVTDTDMSVPSEVDEMRISVASPGGELQQAVARFEPGDPLPPRTLGINSQGDRLGPFTVRAQALRNGSVVVERVADVTLERNRTLVLRIVLTRDCIGQACAAAETCQAGSCRAIAVSPDELEEFDGQLPQGDGSVGPSDDGGPPPDDAGPDAGPVDGCAPATETCNGMDDDCDTMIDEDFDLTSDPTNCGDCGMVCNLANATADCNASNCVVSTCDTGFDDCDGNDPNGCEADLNTDAMHCGTCTNRCSGGTRDCCDGTCC